jgi:hypothetical protein
MRGGATGCGRGHRGEGHAQHARALRPGFLARVGAALFAISLTVCLGGCEGLRPAKRVAAELDAGRPEVAAGPRADWPREDLHDAGVDLTTVATGNGADASVKNDGAANAASSDDGSVISSLDLALDPEDGAAPPTADDAAMLDASSADAEPEPVHEPTPVTTPIKLVITPADVVLMVRESATFTVALVASNGSARDVGNLVIWESSRPDVASIDSAGVATAISVGVTDISARLGGLVAVERLTVAAPSIRAVAITPKTATIAAGETQAFAATLVFTTGEIFDVTGAVVWTSSRPEVAAISLVPTTIGIAVGKAPGDTEIGFTILGFSAHAVLTVTPP